MVPRDEAAWDPTRRIVGWPSGDRGDNCSRWPWRSALTVPGIALRIAGAHPTPWVAAIAYGLAVVGSAFLLAWAAEALQLDVSQGLALAVLALIAVLPEYAVDFVFTWKAGKDPHEYAPLALANMTGGNRLLIGIGWSLVVLLAAWRMRRIAKADGYTGPLDDEVRLGRSHSVEIAFLAVATLYSLTLPLKRTIALFDAVILIGLFVAYMIRVARAPAEEPHLVGPSELIGSLPTRGATRRGRWVARVRRRRDPALRGGLRRVARRDGFGVRHLEVPARAVAGAARVRGAGAAHRRPVRVAAQHRGGTRRARVVEGQPVDAARRVAPDRVRDLVGDAPRPAARLACSARSCS